MLKNGFLAAMIILGALLLQRAAFAAEVINLPPEELAQESVLPVFDKPVSVKNRYIVTDKKFEADVFYGYAMTEPIANVSKLGLALYYNTSESSAWGLYFAKNFSGLSSYAEQLEGQYNLQFDRVPAPEMTGMLDYNVKAFYGKMSLSKSLVINTQTLGSLSIGAIKYTHKTYPLVALGIGEKFYFSKHWSLRADLRLQINEAPVPFLRDRLKPSDPKPQPDEFEDRVTMSTNLDVGLSYLF